MNKILRFGLALVSAGACSSAAPFLAIGDGAELFLTGGLGVRSDDNIYLTSANESDLVFELTPGVELAFGKGARLQGTLSLVDTFNAYADHSGLNTNLFRGDFQSSYQDSKLKLGFNASFHELNQNTVDVRPLVGTAFGLIRRDVFNVAFQVESEVSQVTTISSAVAFAHEDFKRAGFTDSDSLTIPIDVFYKWTSKAELGFGYRFRDYRVDLGSDSTDHFFSVGTRGEFSPKLTGKLAVGYNTRHLDRGGNENGVGVLANFKYELTPKTELNFGGSNDFGTGANGEQQKNTILNALVTAKIAEEWSVNLGGMWRAIDYGARTDDYFEVKLGSTYLITTKFHLTAAFTHREYSTDLGVNGFANNVFSFSASFRY